MESVSSVSLREQFETLNLDLIAARKAVRERDRILDILATLDTRKSETKAWTADCKVRARDAWQEYDRPLLTWMTHVTDDSPTQIALREYQALKREIAVLEAELEALEAQILELEEQLIPYANCDADLERLEKAQYQFILEKQLPYSDKLVAITTHIATAIAEQFEHDEAHSWQTKLRSELSQLARLVDKALFFSKPANLRMANLVDVQRKLDEILGSAYETNHKAQITTRRYLRELADTNLPVNPSHLLRHPLAGLFHIPYSMPERKQALEIWSEGVAEIDRELLGQKRALENLREQLRVKIHNLGADREILLNMIWQADNVDM